jgi:hypothetical protein
MSRLKRRLFCCLLVATSALLVGTGCDNPMQKAQEREARIMERARGLHGSEAAESERECLRSFFTTSLHFTGEGMRYWYEEEGGFMDITGIAYDQLDCKTCHVRSCDSCHAVEKDGATVLSREKARDMNTCLPCHTREGLTFKFDKEKGMGDVHLAAGMVCADCHFGSDVHGDGKYYKSMRSPGGVRIGCEGCHKESESDGPAFDPNTDSHSAHGDLLSCQACHVSNTTACMNCHFGKFLETGERKGNFVPVKEWMLLVNHEGKVTSGSAMTLVHEGKKFLAYVPYYTHSVSPEGKTCGDCHANEAVKRIRDGKNVPVFAFEKGKPVSWEGVIPLVPERLDYVYLDKTEEGWVPLSDDEPAKTQFAAYGEPLTEKQMESLAEEQGE